MTLVKGARLGPYEIVELIGLGGMGEVYRAIDGRLGRQVAIKVLPVHMAGEAESLARFRREARAIAALSHANIVAIFDIGSQADTPYVVNELLSGETLRARMKREQLPLEETLRIGAAIADGLAAAHEKGIIHRDLKPENIFLTTSGGVKILDFGLASNVPVANAPKESEEGDRLTSPGFIMGTVGYAAPEQLRNKSLTPAADIFSFGCVAFEMLLGHMPFRRDSNIETISAVLSEDPFRDEKTGDLPSDLRGVLERCLKKDAKARYSGGAALAQAWREMAANHSEDYTGTMPIRRPLLPRHAVLPTVVAALALLVAAASITVLLRSRNRVIDGGYDLRASDVTGTREARRLTELALKADATGNRREAIELVSEASRLDPRAPIPAAFLAAFQYYSADKKAGERWSAEAKRRLPNASSTYESMLCRYLLPEADGPALMALASSMLELRPDAWRLRLSLAHRHLDRRELPAALANLKRIDVSAPDDRRLSVVLADRASLGDIDGAARDLQRSRLMERPAILAFTKGRIAWSRGNAAEAAKLFDAAAESALVAGLEPVADDARVLAGVARIGMEDFAGAESVLDIAAVKAQQVGLRDSKIDAYGYAAYAALRQGDRAGAARRLQLATSLVEKKTEDYVSLRLFAIRSHLDVPDSSTRTCDDCEPRNGSETLLLAREAWARGDPGAAALLQQAKAEGIDATWFREEASLLAADLGAPPERFVADPPYPNRLRFIAIWELARISQAH